MVHEIDIDLLRAHVVLLIAPTISEFDRLYYDNVTRITDDEYKQIRDEIEHPELSAGCTWLLDNNTVLVFIRNKWNEGEVAHEMIHAAYKLLKPRGFDLDDEEIWAYLGGYLVEEYYNYLRDNDDELRSGDK